MPTGVTVADDGRIFVCYPRWGDPVEFTVAELRDGEEVAYPSAEFNVFDTQRPADCLVSVQSVVVDPAGRLWLLDTGSTEFGPTIPAGRSSSASISESDEVVQTIRFPPDVALETTYLNDIRFDLRRGEAGMAFITDSESDGPDGIIVVDLASGRSWRKLTGHPACCRRRLRRDHRGPAAGRLSVGADGIAISADGERLYAARCPAAACTASRSTRCAMRRRATTRSPRRSRTTARRAPPTAWSPTPTGASTRPTTSRARSSSVSRAASGRRSSTGPDLVFVDTLSVAADGHIYYTVNQVHRQPAFQGGDDLRERPYALMRTPIEGEPVRLRR